ncbi:MAG: hypothetical protein JNL08_18575 [Planctomycetes bacterium]|nr:hypothetical protein [Planctomycetota bacterium]
MKTGAAVVWFVVLLAVSVRAQTGVIAQLTANTPMVVTRTDTTGTTAAAQPAGPLLQNGSIALPTAQVDLEWTVPTPGDARCRFHSEAYPYGFSTTQVFLDCTLGLVGTNVRGHLQIDMDNFGDFPAHLEVDVFDDGVVEVDSNEFQWLSWPPLLVNLHMPLVLTGSVPVRIRMQGWTLAPVGHSIEVRFLPWASGTEDLGSSCAANLVGYIGNQDSHDYFLAALPGVGAEALRFVADGYGPLATFVVSLQSARLPVGAIGLGLGCDDLLAVPLLDGPGLQLESGRWALPVPPLPAGLEFFVQHVSLGNWGSSPRFGVTNVVRYQT